MKTLISARWRAVFVGVAVSLISFVAGAERQQLSRCIRMQNLGNVQATRLVLQALAGRTFDRCQEVDDHITAWIQFLDQASGFLENEGDRRCWTMGTLLGVHSLRASLKKDCALPEAQHELVFRTCEEQALRRLPISLVVATIDLDTLLELRLLAEESPDVAACLLAIQGVLQRLALGENL